MEITIDIEAEMPLFEQLVDQIKRTVAQHKLKPGDNLPSIRQLAGDLQLNNKTVAKAYRLLERDSVGQQSSIGRTPDSSIIIGQGSTIIPDAEEKRARQTGQEFLRAISPTGVRKPSQRNALKKLKH